MADLEVEFVDGRRWRVIAPYRWRQWEVPAGFLTDFASTPRAVWWWLPPTGAYAPAAVIHDYLYVVDRVTRGEADRAFLDAMAEGGVPWVRRRLMYLAVRAAGWRVWRRYRSQDPATLAREHGLTGDWITTPSVTSSCLRRGFGGV